MKLLHNTLKTSHKGTSASCFLIAIIRISVGVICFEGRGKVFVKNGMPRVEVLEYVVIMIYLMYSTHK